MWHDMENEDISKIALLLQYYISPLKLNRLLNVERFKTSKEENTYLMTKYT